MESWHDPKKCARCKYHGTGVGRYVNGHLVHCGYASETRGTCLRIIDGELVDTRGDDYYNCKLFEAGKPPKTNTGGIYGIN